MTLSNEGRGQSVNRTITAAGGFTATAGVYGINIDRTAPSRLKIQGVRAGRKYKKPPRGKCVSSDELAGVASCKLEKSRKGRKVTYIATSTDKAGNRKTKRLRVRISRNR